MPDTFQIYQSELTGPELDEALKNIALVQQSVADAAGNAQAAAASATAAQQAAQQALGFRSFYGGAVLPEAVTGSLDPSRPMLMGSGTSVSAKSTGDRIQTVTLDGYTNQAGTGTPSPINVRAINVAGELGKIQVNVGGGQEVDIPLTAPLCEGDTVQTNVPSGCDKSVVLDGSIDEPWSLSGLSITGYIRAVYSIPEQNVVQDSAISDIYRNALYSEWASVSASAGSFVSAVSFAIVVQVKTNLPNTIENFKTILQENPLTVWYRSTAYTEANDIPVQLETHNSVYQINAISGDSTFSLWKSLTGCASFMVSSTSPVALYIDGAKNAIADTLPSKTNKDLYTNLSAESFGICAQNNGFLAVAIPGVTTAEAAKEYFTEHPATVVYKLATPAVYAHDPVTVEAVPDSDGTWTVTSDCSMTVYAKPFQDGGNADKLGGMTLAQLMAYIDSKVATVAQTALGT